MKSILEKGGRMVTAGGDGMVVGEGVVGNKKKFNSEQKKCLKELSMKIRKHKTSLSKNI